MSTLRELCPQFRYKKGYGNTGIEIETESKKDYSVPGLKYWGMHGDGSLRNVGVEFVLIRPLNHGSKEYAEALVEFNEVCKKVKFENSTYTSVHVHLNFVDREVIHLANFITLYTLFENVLTRYCGPTRDGNLFCLKVKDAEESLALYKELFKNIASGRGQAWMRLLSETKHKYSALNIVPLLKLGSVEVRTHYGTTDTNLIDRWVRILHCLYNGAEEFKSPLDIANHVATTNNSVLVNEIFGGLSKYFDQKELDNDINENLFYLKSLAYAVKDWSTFGTLVEQFVEEEMTLDPVDARYWQQLYTEVTNRPWTRTEDNNRVRTVTLNVDM